VCVSLDHFIHVLLASVVLDLVSTVPDQEMTLLYVQWEGGKVKR